MISCTNGVDVRVEEGHLTAFCQALAQNGLHLSPPGQIIIVTAFDETFHHRLGDRAANDFVPSKMLFQLLESACYGLNVLLNIWSQLVFNSEGLADELAGLHVDWGRIAGGLSQLDA
eukprot:Skav216019  [mRNA]  locus=scaffold417:46721:48783:- [translate_table: standard]